MPSSASGKKGGILHAVNRAVHAISFLYLGEWALYGAFRCPFAVPFVSCESCPVITCPGRVSRFFWSFWGFWLALGLLCGRAFCGWFCPGGALSRALALNPYSVGMQRDAERTFVLGKYLLVIAALWIWFVMGQPRADVPIRVGEFWPSIALTFEHAFPLWLVRTGLVIALFAASVILPAAWCRFACPFGGALELTRRFSPFGVWKGSACNDCGKCRRKCYMNTRPGEHNCTNCGECLGSCPQDCITIGCRPRKPNAS